MNQPVSCESTRVDAGFLDLGFGTLASFCKWYIPFLVLHFANASPFGTQSIIHVAKSIEPFYFLARINLDKHLQQYEYWADRFQQIPLYYMGFHGPVEISTVIEVCNYCQ